MCRKDKELIDEKEIEDIIDRVEVCHIGLSWHDLPYIVPVNFGYQDGAIYFHSAKEGMKIDYLRQNPNVCFQMEIDVTLMKADDPCNWGSKYRSVIGFGKASIIGERSEKIHGLNIIMGHY